MIKKKDKADAESSASGPVPYVSNQSLAPPFQTNDLHCSQCGGRRIPRGAPQFFDFHCTYCGQVNQSRGYVSGTDVQCVACGNNMLVPPPPSRPVPAHLGGVSMAPQRLKFFCVFCGQKLSATMDMIGQPTVCPSCNKGLRVPMPPGSAPSS